jgi:hypothetical protein
MNYKDNSGRMTDFPWHEERDCCPECGEEYEHPHRGPRCICRDPLMICIQPGKHIHIHCPVHGDVKIYGPKITWMQAPPNGARIGDMRMTKFGESPKRMRLTNSMGPM